MKISVPMTEDKARQLRAGQQCLLSGVIYTARDAAHKRLTEALDRGEELPMDLRGAVIYYVGPTPARPGQVIGSAGPTTSGRMDAYVEGRISLWDFAAAQVILEAAGGVLEFSPSSPAGISGAVMAWNGRIPLPEALKMD